MTPEIKTMEAELAELQKKIELAQIAELEARDPAKTLADLIHSLTCRWNHIDGCGWEYENAESYTKPNSSRNGYYVRAKKMLSGEDPKEFIRVLKKFHSTK